MASEVFVMRQSWFRVGKILETNNERDFNVTTLKLFGNKRAAPLVTTREYSYVIFLSGEIAKRTIGNLMDAH
jgi:hypothetical protein